MSALEALRAPCPTVGSPREGTRSRRRSPASKIVRRARGRGPSRECRRGRGSVRRMAACDSQIACPDDRELSHATRRSRAVCRRGIVHGKGWFPGRDVRPAERSRRPAQPSNLPRTRRRHGNFPARIALKTIDSGKLSRGMGPSLPSAPSTPPSVRRSRPRPPVGRAQKSTRKIFRLATH